MTLKTTKKDLEGYIEKLAQAGDQLYDLLDGLSDDPVISAYIKERDAGQGHIWQDTSMFTMRLIANAAAEWDDLIGQLQERRLYQADLMDNDADVLSPA